MHGADNKAEVDGSPGQQSERHVAMSASCEPTGLTTSRLQQAYQSALDFLVRSFELSDFIDV